MSEKSNFIDYVKVNCRSGAGGAGSKHYFRDKTTSKGGPDGGDGGRGGHIILKGNKQMWTLLPLKYRKHIIAENGQPGRGGNSTGASGKDVILEVPLGTIAKDEATGKIEYEITEHNQKFVLVAGGRGGLGNSHFKSSTNQTPQYAQPGEGRTEAWKILELKVLADVGLVGFPNAGKSTLLSVISAAKPEIADYPFTTLTPNLGIVKYDDIHSFIMADIPGIIENAHQGKGLGHRFLKHIERNSILLFLVPIDADDIVAQYKILENELKQFNPELLDKDRILAISKADLADKELIDMIKKESLQKIEKEIEIVFFSSFNKKGINELKSAIWKRLNTYNDTENQ